MIRVMLIIGTRPEAIKMAPVVKEFEKHPDIFTPIVCVTAQHREMLDQVLSIFKIIPDYDLNIMQPNQTLSRLTATLIGALDDVMVEAKPDWVLVQGDTSSAMAAGLVAFYHGIKVGHIEAGLRTHDIHQPFPEEANRRITDIMSELYFSPTPRTRDNLISEGVHDSRILVTGNSVIDALLMMVERLRTSPVNTDTFLPQGHNKRVILVTSHRRENFGEPFAEVCRAVKQIASQYGDSVHVVFPVHYNPNVRIPAHEILGNIANISLTDPLDYEAMVQLMDSAYMIMTDSGGVQEEAPSLNKPMLILRELTERQEVVEVGAAKLVGCNYDRIVAEATHLLEDDEHYARMAAVPNPYGDGTTSRQITQAIMQYQNVSHPLEAIVKV
jgi:UDP-N-acetylglucosamine 2-epimerase (non-hydrolysing)